MEKLSINAELLLSLIEERPVLWDKTLDTYKSKLLREAAWQEIYSMLVDDYDEMSPTEKHQFGLLVVKRWTHMRDSWCKQEKKIKQFKKYGIKPGRPYKYAEQLSFLKKACEDEDSDEDGTIDSEEERDTEESLAERRRKEIAAIKEMKTKRESSSKEDSVQQECSSVSSKEDTFLKRKQVVVFDKMVKLIDNANTQKQAEDDPHLHFFKSLLPITSTLDQDETLQFQGEVIRLLQDIKRHRSYDGACSMRVEKVERDFI